MFRKMRGKICRYIVQLKSPYHLQKRDFGYSWISASSHAEYEAIRRKKRQLIIVVAVTTILVAMILTVATITADADRARDMRDADFADFAGGLAQVNSY